MGTRWVQNKRLAKNANLMHFSTCRTPTHLHTRRDERVSWYIFFILHLKYLRDCCDVFSFISVLDMEKLHLVEIQICYWQKNAKYLRYFSKLFADIAHFLKEWSCWIGLCLMLQRLIIINKKASFSLQLSNKNQNHRSVDNFYFLLICGFSLSISRTNTNATMSIILMLSIILCADVKLLRYSCTSTTIYHMV